MDEFSLSNPLNKDPNRLGRLASLQKDDPRYVEGTFINSKRGYSITVIDVRTSDAALQGWLVTSREAASLRPRSVQDLVARVDAKTVPGL